MHTVAVALIGVGGSMLLAKRARRYAVIDRLRLESPRARLLPAPVRARLSRALDDAAVKAPPEQAVQVWLLAGLVASVIGAGMSVPTGVVAAVGVGVGGPLGLHAARHRRARIVATAVPEAIEGIASELRSGGTVATAVSAIARGESALAPDLARVENRVLLGAPLAHALREWSRERPVAGVEAAAGALALSSTVGGRSADALDGLASSLRGRLGVLAESRALSAQARYSAGVIGLAPLGYLAASAVLDPRSVQALVSTTAGRLCAVVGLALEALGATWMRTIVSGAEIA